MPKKDLENWKQKIVWQKGGNNTGLDVPLKELKWAEFARRYNGARYGETRYDKRLEEEAIRNVHQVESGFV